MPNLKNKKVIKDQQGQRKYPGRVTKIQGNTMATTGYGDIPLYVVPNVGNPMLVPANSGNRVFPGASSFIEYPIPKNSGWLEKYQVGGKKLDTSNWEQSSLDSLNAYNKGQRLIIETIGNNPDELREAKKNIVNLPLNIRKKFPKVNNTQVNSMLIGPDIVFMNKKPVGVQKKVETIKEPVKTQTVNKPNPIDKDRTEINFGQKYKTYVYKGEKNPRYFDPKTNKEIDVSKSFDLKGNYNPVYLDKKEYGGLLDTYQDGGKTLEEKINKALGDPRKKASDAAINKKWFNKETKKWEVEDDIDNFRHPMAARYTAEAIANKFPDWMKYSGMPQVAGFVGSTALGVGHELANNKYTSNNPKDYPNYTFWDTVSEAGEDAFNNMVGAGVGVLPISDDKKTSFLRYLSDNNKIPDGYANKKANMYFKRNGGLIDTYGDNPKAQVGKALKEYENDKDPISHLKWGKYIDDPKRREQHIIDVYQYLMDSNWEPNSIVDFMKKNGAYGSKNRGDIAKKGADWGWDSEDINNEVLGKAWDDYYNNRTVYDKKEYGGWLDTYQVGGKVSPYKPATINEYNFRNKMYSDSLALAKQSRKLNWIWPENPNITKEEHNKLRELEDSYPQYNFLQEQYDIDKKKKNVGNFKDYIQQFTFGDEDTKTKSITGKDLSEGIDLQNEKSKKAENKYSKEWVDKKGLEYKFTPDGYDDYSGFLSIYDPQSGTTVDKFVYKDYPENNQTLGLYNKYIKPTETLYKGNKNKKIRSEVSLSSSSTGWYDSNKSKPKFKNTSNDKYIGYDHQTEEKELYPFPKQKILKPDKNAPKGEDITMELFLKNKEKNKKQENKEPVKTQVVNIPNPIDEDRREVNFGQKYKTYVYKGEKNPRYKDPTTGKDLDPDISKSFDLKGDYNPVYLEKKEYGGWLDAYQDGGKTLAPFSSEDNDSWFENILEIADPTGISSWDDVYRAYKNKGIGEEVALELLGSIPLLGKVKKAGRLVDDLANAFAITKKQKNNAKIASGALKGIGKYGPSAGRVTDAVQAALGAKDDSGFTWDLRHGEVPQYGGRNLFPKIELGEHGDYAYGGWLDDYQVGGLKSVTGPAPKLDAKTIAEGKRIASGYNNANKQNAQISQTRNWSQADQEHSDRVKARINNPASDLGILGANMASNITRFRNLTPEEIARVTDNPGETINSSSEMLKDGLINELVGYGATKAIPFLYKSAKAAGKYLTEETALKNVFNLNPKARITENMAKSSSMPQSISELANTGFKSDPDYHLNAFNDKKKNILENISTPEGKKRIQNYIDNNPHLQLRTVDDIIEDFNKTSFVTETPRYDYTIDNGKDAIKGGWIKDAEGYIQHFPVDPNNAFNWYINGYDNPSWVSMGQNFTPYDAQHVLEHEFAHLFQKGNKIKGVDDELEKISLKSINPFFNIDKFKKYNPFIKKYKDKAVSASEEIFGYKNYLNTGVENQKNYWKTGSEGQEKAAFSAEIRENLLQRGLIKNRYDEITPELLKKHFELYKNTIGDKYNLRLYDIMKKDSKNFKYLSTALNKLPALVPYVGAGALAADKFLQKNKQDNGQWLNKYQDGGYVVNSGDNLSTIAKNNNTDIATLQSLNNIKDVNRISIGQNLILPKKQDNTSNTNVQTAQIKDLNSYSFNEAFKIARKQLGPNKIFEHNGKKFGTNLAGEKFVPNQEELAKNNMLNDAVVNHLNDQNKKVDSVYTTKNTVKLQPTWKENTEIDAQNQEFNKLKNAELINKYQSLASPNEKYIIVDKKKGKMHVYLGGKEIDSYNVGTGENKGDEQTRTWVDKKTHKTDWSKGNKQTGAGIYTISFIDEHNKHYSNAPSFHLKNESGTEVPTAIHAGFGDRLRRVANNDVKNNDPKSGEDTRFSNGCINGLCKDMTDLYKNDLKQDRDKNTGTKVFILPDDDSNYFSVKNNKLNFTTSGKYNQTTAYSPKNLNASPIKIKVLNKDFDTKEVKNMAKTLEDNKSQIMKDANIDNDTYNKLSKMAISLSLQETKGGTDYNIRIKGYGIPGTNKEEQQGLVSGLKNAEALLNKYKKDPMSSIKDFAKLYLYANGQSSTPPKITEKTSVNSKGMTQIKYDAQNKELVSQFKKYGITKDNLNQGKNAAIATVLMLSYMHNNELPSLKEKIKKMNISDEEALLYLNQGKKSEIVNGTATPKKNMYIKNIKKYSDQISLKQQSY